MASMVVAARSDIILTIYLFVQACSGLPETGVVDSDTWIKLLGEDASPDKLATLTNEYEDDLTDSQGAVWLIGEQRWSRPARS